MLQGVTVWLDNLAPVGGGFGQALVWAERFHLPLRGIILQEAEGELTLLDTCADQCRQHSVAWSVVNGKGRTPHDLLEFLHPSDFACSAKLLRRVCGMRSCTRRSPIRKRSRWFVPRNRRRSDAR